MTFMCTSVLDTIQYLPLDYPRIKIVKDVPMMDISATFIRNAIRDKKSIQYLVPEKVFDYLDGSQMYK